MEKENSSTLCNWCTEYCGKTCKHATLSHAAFHGHTKCVKWLIEAGADVNSLNRETETLPLVIAAGRGHDEVVKALLEAGADVNKFDPRYNSAMIKAFVEGKYKCVELLKKAGVDVNMECPLGISHLMLAAGRGGPNCVELFIQLGADVNRRSSDNSTPLIHAVHSVREDIIELLIKAGADVNAADDSGMTALITAAAEMQRPGLGCVKLLLRSGALINMFDFKNHNALQYHIAFNYCLLAGIDEWAHHFNGGRPNRDMCIFLFAAGETIDGTTVKAKGQEFPVPDYLLFEDLKFSLKHRCRMVIRKRLLSIDPHKHLFGRVPGIGLPASLSEYLLFGESLEAGGRVVTGKLVTEDDHLNYEYDSNDSDTANT